MELNKKNVLSILGIIGAAILFYRTLEDPQILLDFCGTLLELIFPLLLGFCIAFVLNVPMRFLEKHILQKTQKPLLQKLRRIICILISLVFIVTVLTAVLFLVIPEIVNAIEVLASAVPDFLNDAQQWTVARLSNIPQLKEKIASLQINWAETGSALFSYVTSGAGNLLGSTVNFVVDFAGSLVNIMIGFIFAIYILLSKEKLKTQVQMLLRATLPRTMLEKVNYVVRLTSRTFSNFIAGQCMEACILGTLCWLGMLLFRFPYAPMVGALVGLTALIPIVGGIVGTVVGAFMIMMINPIQAIWFILFLQCLQQIEGNFIYPRVVGSSVGLPPIWVLAAVTLGGSLGGIVGMLFAVPVASVLFALSMAGVHEKLKREDV